MFHDRVICTSCRVLRSTTTSREFCKRHVRSEKRIFVSVLFTARHIAFLLPMTTTSFRPRVIAVYSRFRWSIT